MFERLTDVKNAVEAASFYGVQYVPTSICNLELILSGIFTLCTISKQRVIHLGNAWIETELWLLSIFFF